MGKMLNLYCKLYYGSNAISSIYAWELGESLLSGFSVCILISNESSRVDYLENTSENSLFKNFINSTNSFNVRFSTEVIKNKEVIKVNYRLQSTMQVGVTASNDINLGGSVTKSFEENYYIKDYSDNEFHIEKIGKMLESAENNLRIIMEEIAIKKYQDIQYKIKPDIYTSITRENSIQLIIEGHKKIDEDELKKNREQEKLESFKKG